MTTANPSPRRRRWPIVLLVVSLLLNLFFVGAIGGRILAGVPETMPFVAPVAPNLPRIVDTIPEEHRPVAQRAFRRHASEINAAMEQMREARDTVFAAMTAEDFDQDALQDAFGMLRERTFEAQTLVHGILVEIGSGLSPEGRDAMVEAARRHFGQGPRGPHGPRAGDRARDPE